MSADPCQADEALPLQVTRQIDALCDEFEVALRKGGGVLIEPYLDRVEPPGRQSLMQELAVLALEKLRHDGSADPHAALLGANPGLRAELERLLPSVDGELTARHEHGPQLDWGSGLAVRCPHCHNSINLIVDASLIGIACPSCGGSFSLINDADHTRDATAMTRVAHFEIIERLGMGEFGTVWKARDTILDRTVALKIPRREQLDAASVEKFMREARAAAQLRHPNIVSTHEVGRHADVFYIVSDYIRGVSLADMISDHRLGIRESATMAAKIADALDHAHRSGVIHRDLKPSNILIDDFGEPHLMDFGLAKRKEREVTITTEGAILGTPAYMSPEQARGEASHVDGRSDVYSLGVLLFQLLTGELPFRGSTRMLLQKVVNDDPPAPRTLDSHVPKDLDTICLKCLEKEPSRRYASAGDLGADLRHYLAGEPVAARRLGRAGRSMRWARRNPVVSLLLASTMLILLAATAISSYFAWRSAQNSLLAAERAVEVTDKFYDSRLQEIRLTREVREQGYGVRVRELIDQVQELPTDRIDRNELRRQLVLTLGDFVAYPPQVLPVFEDRVMALRANHDGSRLFVGLNNGSLVVCDAKDGANRLEVTRFASPVTAIAVSAGDDRLFAADQQGSVRTWRLKKGAWEEEQSFNLGVAPNAVFFSGNGEQLALVKDALLEVWDVGAAKKLLSPPTEPTWKFRNAAFDIEGRKLIAGYRDLANDTVGWVLWGLESDEELHHVEMPSLGNTYANDVDFSLAGDQIAIGFDEALLVYDTTEFQPIKLSGFDSTKAVAFSPASPYLAAANIRGWINVWNSTTHQQLATLQISGAKVGRNCLSFSRDGKKLIAAQADAVQVWDLTRADEKTVFAGHEGGIPCAVFHPDGRVLATGGKDDEVRFWDPMTGELLNSIRIGEAVQTLAFSPDGRLLAVGGMGRLGAPHLRIINVDSKQVIHQAALDMGEVYSLAWADGEKSRFLAGSGLYGVGLWKVPRVAPATMEESIALNRDYCPAVVIDPEARFMLWAENERRLVAWDIAASRPLPLHAPVMQQGWHGVTLLPDGKSIIYVSDVGVAEIWNVREDRRIDSFGEPGTFGAPHLALSPDGQWFAALTQPDAVSVWHRPTGDHVFSLRPESGTVWSLAWDPTSQNLAVGQSDGGLAVWHLPKIKQQVTGAGLPWQAAAADAPQDALERE